MKALVYHGPGRKAWEEVPEPVIIADTDAIVRVDAVTICGTDLHILKGDVPEVTDGRILGHEAVGTVEAGRRRREEREGRRPRPRVVHHGVRRVPVLPRRPLRPVPRRRRLDPRPPDRRHAGRVRARPVRRHLDVPDSRRACPTRRSLMVADILPTGYEVGVLNGKVAPGDVVAIVGAGPIGLSAIMGARLYSPAHIVAIDLAATRLEAAKQFGADIVVNPAHEDALEVVRGLTDGLGADVAIEAVGTPATFELTVSLARPGGHIANIGVHGEPATLHLEDLWSEGRHHHHRSRRHVLDADVPAAARRSPTRREPVRDAPLRARRVRAGLRRVPAGRRDRRAEGAAHPLLTKRSVARGKTTRGAS